MGLLASVPNPEAPRERLVSIPGSPPDLLSPPAGCAFAGRCRYCRQRCREETPEMREIEPGRFVACHFVEEAAKA